MMRPTVSGPPDTRSGGTGPADGLATTAAKASLSGDLGGPAGAAAPSVGTAAGRPAGARGAAGDVHRIGEVAMRAGVTTRTLRYYQELGLLDPGHSPGGSRRYSDADVARLQRIIELRSVMGFDLERIREILYTEDRLGQLRQEAQREISTERRREIVAEAIVLNDFQSQLESKAAHCATIAHELGMDDPGHVPR